MPAAEAPRGPFTVTPPPSTAQAARVPAPPSPAPDLPPLPEDLVPWRTLALQVYGLFPGRFVELESSAGPGEEAFGLFQQPLALGGVGLSVDAAWQVRRSVALGLRAGFTRQTLEYEASDARLNALWAELGPTVRYTVTSRRMRGQLFAEGMWGYLGSFGRVEDMRLHGMTLRFALGVRVPRTRGAAFVASAVLLFPLWVRMEAFAPGLPTSNPGYITVFPPFGLSFGVSWGAGTLAGRNRRGW